MRTDALPDPARERAAGKLKNPIEQQMVAHNSLFRQQNIERREVLSVREWTELCAKDEMRIARAKGAGEGCWAARARSEM